MRSLQGLYRVIFSQLARFRRRVPVAPVSSPRSAGVRTSSLAVGRQASPPGCPPKSFLQLISPAALTLWSPGTGCAPPALFTAQSGQLPRGSAPPPTAPAVPGRAEVAEAGRWPWRLSPSGAFSAAGGERGPAYCRTAGSGEGARHGGADGLDWRRSAEGGALGGRGRAGRAPAPGGRGGGRVFPGAFPTRLGDSFGRETPRARPGPQSRRRGPR